MDTSASDPRFVTCSCQSCKGHIEFDFSHAGEWAICPHCGMRTQLHMPASRRGFNSKKNFAALLGAAFVVLVCLGLFNHVESLRIYGVYHHDLGDGESWKELDFRSDGSVLLTVYYSHWSPPGGTQTISKWTKSGSEIIASGGVFKKEGNDLIDAQGNRWVRIH